MSATWRLLPRIEGMMFCLAGLVKRAWIGPPQNETEVRRVRVGSCRGGQRWAERAFRCAVALPVVVHGLGAPRVGRIWLCAHAGFKAMAVACAGSRRPVRYDRRCE